MCSCNTPIYNNCECKVSAVDMVVNEIYLTTDELNTLKNQIELNFANSQSWFNELRFGIVNKDKNYRKDLFLLIIFFSYWNQHSDGSDAGLFNYATRLEFSTAVNKAKRIVAGTIIN